MLAAMNAPTSPTPNSSAPNLAQVDPPRPLRGYLWPILIGLVVTSVGMAYFYGRLGGIAPVASGTVPRLQMFPIHNTPDPDMPGPGFPGAAPDQDQVIVLAQVQVKNISKAPLELFDLSAMLTLPQEQRSSLGASPANIDRLLQAYPDLAAAKTQPLVRHQVLTPGQTAQGLVVFNYPLSQQQWDQRKGLKITVSFTQGSSLVLNAQ